jgi:choline kinase/quercetin dioxygenase-like cupin family protein/thiamine kinase-like enzyme
MKTIYKPWGKELWLELNDKYCYKRIHINAGTKTSYQYHVEKLETNYIIEGKAEVWLENDEGVVEKKIMKAGDFFTVHPPKKHRVIAITDIVLQEVSTPEVDDVIRISDDSDRGDGKIEHEHMKPALCILTAGMGSRLENLSTHINKGLLPLDNKAVITHIIDKTPKEYEIVIALGYKGNMVREYCEAAHPNRNFEFVEVDDFKGENTGPSYSINKCKEYLQRPFYWVTCDIIITENLPKIDNNWIGVCPTSITELYSTVNVDGENVTALKNKDKNGYGHAVIGLAGVYDYETFWNQLDVKSGEIVSAYYDMNKFSNMKAKQFNWYDIGTVDNYLRAQKIFKDSVTYSIPKTNGEFLYKVDDNFIKLCSDKKFINGRINRSKELDGLVPTLNYSGSNLYSYNWKKGKTLYDCDIEILKNFLSFCEKEMWKPIGSELDCSNFYKNKTMSRLEMFLSGRDDSYKNVHNINGVDIESINHLMDNFDWNTVLSGKPTKIFHGDLQFDNVVYGEDNKFYLIDWRQDFNGESVGDMYYDLAKMYGGVLMSYKLMKDANNFKCFIDGKNVDFKYKSDGVLDEFRSIYEKWILDMGYDLKKIKKITSLIFLNMAPLHEKEFGDMLFFKSKEMLQNDK